MNLVEKINETTQYLINRLNVKPDIGIILGSGLGSLADEISDATIIKYNEVPNFPTSTVQGHKGQLVVGTLEGKRVIAMQGRFHYYEGYPIEQVTFPVRVMKALGVESIIITNAAGGVNREFTPGDLMVITDHINFTFDNPLIGENHSELGPRFPDMSHAYDKSLINIAIKSAEKLDLTVRQGVYMWNSGPTYETPAEVRLASFLGADAVGMSTVPEVIAAVHGNIKVLGISCITNMASGILDQPLNHKEVIETSERVKNDFISLIKKILKEL
ncbi:purine-nucleoside phosphorylase [Proteiniborus sp. MB09-C3]|uniref:purine-nucleoside phosphorylase n=1 Tax=Proteiniborus sp. MB09-C3 TaxID=3050072 RepID=UPI00255474C2|nr:purine-nucleoside phosphorylase [Proteiniborus sp. MB09-C3]WIV10975.1 purine-nucleoside phosphorylase [Proteiniborus sp. MB09-C3]